MTEMNLNRELWLTFSFSSILRQITETQFERPVTEAEMPWREKKSVHGIVVREKYLLIFMALDCPRPRTQSNI